MTQEPVTVAEQPVTELLIKMVNKKQLESSVPILLRCNGDYVGSATQGCRYLWYAWFDITTYCQLLCTLKQLT